jgi:glycosyltransferase involved in cell wall biosynthesis
LSDAKKVCTLHLGGHFHPKKDLRAWRFGATAMVMRQFDTLIAINPEVASFLERVGVKADRTHRITPFPRLRVSESVTLSDEIETFCRQHTPLIASVDDFEQGSDLTKQFDILSKVRERYPSAGLLAIGDGPLHFKYMYARALHTDGNHIEMTGSLSDAATSELIQRANVLLHSGENRGDSFAMEEARKANTQVVGTNQGAKRAAAYLSAAADVEVASLQVLRSLQIARPQYEGVQAALTDGVDDVIRLYKQLSAKREEATPLQGVTNGPVLDGACKVLRVV